MTLRNLITGAKLYYLVVAVFLIGLQAGILLEAGIVFALRTGLH